MNAFFAAVASASSSIATLDSATPTSTVPSNTVVQQATTNAPALGALGYVLGALLILASIVMIIVIILQEGNQQGLGVVSGGADTFFSKNKARSIDAMLARTTKWFAFAFVAIVLVLNIIAFFAK